MPEMIMPESVYERAVETLLLDHDLAVVWINFGPDAMVVVAEDGMIHLANRQAELLTGYPRHVLQTSRVDILVPDARRDLHSDHRDRFMEEPRLRPMGRHLNLHLRRRNGAEIPVDINLNPVATSRGVFVVATIRRKVSPSGAEQGEP